MAVFVTDNREQINLNMDIDLILKSPIFNEENTYSYPTKIDYTPDVSIILGRPEEINSVNKNIREISGRLVAGSFNLYGILRVLSFSEGKYEVCFIGQGKFNFQLSNLKLGDIDFGNIVSSDIINREFSGTDMNEYYFKDPEGNNSYCFPMFFNLLEQKSFPQNSPEGHLYLNNLYYVAKEYWNYAAVVPCFFLEWIISNIFKKLNYTVVRNFFNKPELSKIIQVCNYNISDYNFEETGVIGSISKIEVIENKVVITCTNATNLDDRWIQLYDCNFVNDSNYDGRVFVVYSLTSTTVTLLHEDSELPSPQIGNIGKWRELHRNDYLPDTFPISKCLPEIKVKDYLNIIKDYFNLAIIPGESVNKVSVISMEEILLNPEYKDISKYAGILKDIELNNIDGYTFKFGKVDNDSYFSEKQKDIGTEHTIKPEVNSFNELPYHASDNEIRFVKSENAYYIFKKYLFSDRLMNSETTVNIGGWKFFSDNITIGSGSEQIEIKVFPMRTFQHFLYWKNFRMPRFDTLLNANYNPDKTSISVRLMIFDYLAANRVPIARSHNNNIRFHLDGTNGIINKYYKNTIYWKTYWYRRAVSRINWPVYLLNSFSWETKIRINETKFLVKEIPLRINKNDIIEFGDTGLVRVF
jgi:hypothetical protein